jgi:putative transposase
VYYEAHPREYHSTEFREAVMAKLDYWNTTEPAWGVQKLIPLLEKDGLKASRDLIYELQAEMGLKTIYPHKNLSKANQNARKMPYLLKNMRANNMIWLPNLVWAIDITYIKMGMSHMFLTAVIDWFSRFIVGWHLSELLDTDPVICALKSAFSNYGYPAIINSDQGTQFTSDDYIKFLADWGIRQSMDGKARWADNVVIERFFRSLKVENIYIYDYCSPRELRIGISSYIDRYNSIRPHQSLDYKTPFDVYHSVNFCTNC